MIKQTKNTNYNPGYRNVSDSLVKRIVNLLSEQMNINPNKYDFTKSVSYTCKGYDLTGSSANTRDSNRHFLVNPNRYEVHEIPMRSNRGLRMTGDFIFLIKDINNGWWYIGKMKHQFIQTKDNIIHEKVDYFCEAELEITIKNDKISAHCVNGTGKNCRGFKTKVFDDDNNRKEKAYHTTWKVINKSFGIKKL